ncbi:MAG: DUF4347 domain-containing protein, partial [Proteobacteria bacterium]|nr:DUF4347 domain-containing protein [Pseudomonadota bacterium]
MLNFLKRRTEHPKQNRSKLAYDGAHDSYGPQKLSVADSLQALEPRIMFDAAGVATGSEVAADEIAEDQAQQALTPENLQAQAVNQENEQTDELIAALGDVVPPADRNEIIFIDTDVENYETLLTGISSSVEVVLLDETRDGIEQIAEIMSSQSDVSAIHIISHGESGSLSLGNGTLTQESMTSEHADELATIKNALSESADILIYGCNFAEGESGQSAAATLATLTGADIAASEDISGHESLGGDWDLEYEHGEVENEIIISESAQESWVDTLAEVVNTSGAQTGSYTVAAGVTQITITITGGDGGNAATTGGQGATVTSTFNVTAGDVVEYVVAEAGKNGTSAGGGGSTGVFINDILVMVAGGGGGGDNSGGAIGLGGNDADLGTAADSGTGGNAGAGGTAGAGGGATTTGTDAGGGGGINSAGGSGSAGGGAQADTNAVDGVTLVAGGTAVAGYGAGGQGFSGGGGGDAGAYSGGGGGYSGGGGAGAGGSAGGGGSYINTGAANFVSGSSTPGGDGTGTLADGTIVITDNNPIDAVDDTATADEDAVTAIVINVLANDTTTGPGTVTVPGGMSANGGTVAVNPDNSINYTPAADFSGTDTITYTYTEGAFSDTATVTITVNPDTDEDGVLDNVDVDDDNDGILDVDEGFTGAGDPINADGDLERAALTSTAGIISSSNGDYDPNAPFNVWNTTGTVDWSEGQYVRFSSTTAHTDALTDGLTIKQSNVDGGAFAIFSYNGERIEQTTAVQAGVTYTASFELGLLPDYGINDGFGNGTFAPDLDFGLTFSGTGLADINRDETDLAAGSNVSTDYPDIATVTAATAASPMLLDPEWELVTFTFTPTTSGTVTFFATINSNGSVITLDSLRLVGGTTVIQNQDTDNDGIIDSLDLDSDNDGISDLEEGGATSALKALDANNDGYISTAESADADGDGLIDAFETEYGANQGVDPSLTDTDSDGIADFNDLDSDNDGIADVVEAQTTAGYTYDGTDTDGDGIVDTFDTGSGHGGDFTLTANPNDHDGDGIADYMDTDSDGDGILDANESGLSLVGFDGNNDGIDDGVNASYADPDGDVNTPSTDLENDDDPGPAGDVDFRDDDVSTLADDTNSVSEDATGNITGDVSTNDPINNVEVTSSTPYSLVSPAIGTYGTLTFNTDGTYSYNLDESNPTVQGLAAGATLSEVYTYRITDDDGDIQTATLTITINGADDAPVNTVPGAQTVNEDTVLNLSGISVNDVEGNLATTQLTVTDGDLNVSLAGGATISAGANGSNTLTLSGTQAQINAALATLTYQGDLNFNGSDTLTVLSTDSSGVPLTDTDTVSITVDAVNDLPVVDLNGGAGGADYSASFVQGDGPLSITDAAVAVTDIDDSTLDRINIIVAGLLDGASEELTIGATTFPLNADITTTATVGGIVYDVVYNSGTGAMSIDRNDSTEMTLAEAQAVLAATSYQNTSGSVTDGDRTFTVTVNDGDINSLAATSTISVSDGIDDPVDATDNNYDTLTDTAVSGNVITDDTGAGVDTDPDTSPITVDPSLVSTPTNGSVTMNPDGSFTYTPNAGFTGSDTFTYRASTPTTITGLSYEYFDSVPGTFTVDDIPLSGADATGNATDFDVSALDTLHGGDNETYSVRYSGYITITTAGTYNFRTTSDDGSKLFIDGTELVDNDGLHASTTVTSAGTFLTAGTHRIIVEFFENTGGDNLTVEYSGTDTGGLGTFADLSGSSTLVEGSEDTATVTIDIGDLDAVNDTGSVTEDGAALTVNAASGLLANDVFVSNNVTAGVDHEYVVADDTTNNDLLEDSISNDDWDFGTGTLNTNTLTLGTDTNYPGLGESISFPTNLGVGATMAGNFDPSSEGSVSFEFWVKMDSTAPADNYIIFETGSQNNGFSIIYDSTNNQVELYYDDDDSGDTAVLTANLGSIDPTSEFIQIVATMNDDEAAGTDDIILHINGGSTVSGGVTTSANLGADLDWADNNGSGLGTTNGSRETGGVTAQNFRGEMSIMRIYDSVLSTTNVESNFANVANHLYVSSATGSTTDSFVSEPSPGSASTLSITSNGGASVTISPDGAYTYDHGALFQNLAVGETTTDTFNYTVTDVLGNTDTATVTITITGTNDAPILTIDNAGSVTEDSGATLTDTGTLSFTDVDTSDLHTVSSSYNADAVWSGGALTGAQITALTSGTFTANASGWTYSVANSATDFLDTGETVTFTYDVTVDDGNGGTDTEAVTITINGVNDAPVNTVPGAQSVNEDATLAFAGNISVNDVDGNLATTQLTVTDGDLNVSLAGGASISAGSNNSSTLTLSGTQAQINAALATLTYQGDANFNGSDTLTVLSTDSGGVPLSDNDTVSITVTPVDDSYTDADEVVSVAEDSGANSGSVLTGTSSVDGPVTVTTFMVAGDATVYQADGTGTGDTATIAGVGTLQIQTNGAYTFTPAADYNGAVPVATYTTTDGSGTDDTSTLTITVTPVDDSYTDADEVVSVAEDSGANSGSVLTGTSSVDGPVT